MDEEGWIRKMEEEGVRRQHNLLPPSATTRGTCALFTFISGSRPLTLVASEKGCTHTLSGSELFFSSRCGRKYLVDKDYRF